MSFEAIHTRQIITKELSSRKNQSQKAALRKLMETLVITVLGPKYPKLCPPDIYKKAMDGEMP